MACQKWIGIGIIAVWANLMMDSEKRWLLLLFYLNKRYIT